MAVFEKILSKSTINYESLKRFFCYYELIFNAFAKKEIITISNITLNKDIDLNKQKISLRWLFKKDINKTFLRVLY